ncbi:MAG: carbon-phosphorus lyase complex subunit PhnI [Desulfosarcina sp.]|nr:carbon-phosphorus lyase complex subunit PhnI [Desulfosarcina sp.]MBC2742718.1 carbon-phosphorus lyase complex subunit PhnI [Desulfosarcina sp.]MBC2765628.1 carbon-phosphorus lyase complex subunit PhnI [Desulfosarcina sp.]
MYVAVKGGEEAIANAHKLLAEKRRGDRSVPELEISQIKEQLGLSVDRVMTEGSLYDRELAAIAIKQAQGDLVEAIFLLRAYRTTLPRFGFSEPIETATMEIQRRISSSFKDIPGGQVLGPTYDYTHRLIDFALRVPENGNPGTCREEVSDEAIQNDMPRVADLLAAEGLLDDEAANDKNRSVADLTRDPLELPAGREMRLQNLARGDEGFILSLAYSLLRGFGSSGHPFLGEIRFGEVTVEFVPQELGFPIDVGGIPVTECIMFNRFMGSGETPPRFIKGYGLTFGHCERKAMAMALVDYALRSGELGEKFEYPAQDEEFVLFHSDNVQASGFVEHLKLPHYVDFQADLVLMRNCLAEFKNDSRNNKGIEDEEAI